MPRVKETAKGGPDTWLYVELHWDDACSDTQWRGLDELIPVSRIVTRGWIVRSTRTEVVVVGTYRICDDGDTEVSEIISLPRGCIRSAYEIEATIKRPLSLRTLK